MKYKRRFSVVFVVMLVTTVMLTMPVFASVDGVGGGFSLWNLLDGLGGFFLDLINSISSFFGNLISAIGNAINSLLSALKALLIPSKESFSKFLDDILYSFDVKFGSIFTSLDYLKSRFGNLDVKSDGLMESFKISFPRESFLYGINIDFLASFYDVIMFFRFCISGFYCVMTAIICYHKVIAMINK